MCGFVSHNALLGCSKCLKPFPTTSFGKKPDYSGFDKINWTKRQIERDHGCRYSVLLELPYSDVERMCIIDPIHNLLLGTAKHMLSVWKSCKLLTDNNFQTILDKIDAFIVPDDVGRIPSKIASGFAGFTAEQWKNWILLYSLSALKGCLPFIHYNCWLLFVKACRLVCS